MLYFMGSAGMAEPFNTILYDVQQHVHVRVQQHVRAQQHVFNNMFMFRFNHTFASRPTSSESIVAMEAADAHSLVREMAPSRRRGALEKLWRYRGA